MEISHNHNSKSQLAKLLASENISVQHSSSAKTAWFDVKNRVLMLPVWREMSNDLYDLLVVHEVGHALDTPSEEFVETLKKIAKRVVGSDSANATMAVKNFLNVIEDARIDKRQKRRFPGSRRNYVQGYKELIERDFFGTATRDVNSMKFIDRLNIYCKGGSMLGIKFTAEEKVWVNKVEAAETFEEVLALTEEIFAWSKDKMEQEQDQESHSDDSGDDSDESDTSFSSFEDGENQNYSDQSDDEDDDWNDESDFDDDESNKSDNNNRANRKEEKEEDEIPESETEKAWQKNIETLVENSEFRYVYTKIPKLLDYNKTVIDYKQVLSEQKECLSKIHHSIEWQNAIRLELQKFKADEKATISFMIKEFEMRKAADEHSRTSIAKTGVIDTNKLHSYKYNDDLFRRITTVSTGKNHGFVMFVDWSGSMDTNLKNTVRQLLSLVMFCRQVQVPFEVYTFRSVSYFDQEKGRNTGFESMFTSNPNELNVSSFFARNVLSSRMNAQELNDAMFHMYLMGSSGRLDSDQLGSTPLNQAIIVAPEIVNRFKARSKVQIVNTIFLTDGESDPIHAIHNLGYSHQRDKYIIQDDVLKKNYEVPAAETGKYTRYSLANKYLTPILLKILRDRTGCNLIGFYITSDGFDREYREFNPSFNNEHYVTAKTSWTTNGFFGVTNAGYDEYYILNPKMFKVSKETLTIDNDASKRKIASAFIKFSEKKTVSRVLLSQVVKRIAA